ncbi:putative WRKY transcription factor 75 [Bidens hawaiensis]|uniref:putative WRKY transcription factor 75 n=1 Tax=Bidens hawaiensis TaxID=980011 RepID=UPI00404A47DB
MESFASGYPYNYSSSSSHLSLDLMHDYSHASYSTNDDYEDDHDQKLGLFGKPPNFGSDHEVAMDSGSGLSMIHVKKFKSEKKKTRKPKCAFQTRSQVDILDDGYRWRKYGQKAVKNSKFPRSYYRCTYEGCNVKKQVQRLSEDEEVVETTYEGTHSHPIEKPNNNFEHILAQMQIYSSC